MSNFSFSQCFQKTCIVWHVKTRAVAEKMLKEKESDIFPSGVVWYKVDFIWRKVLPQTELLPLVLWL